MKKFNFFINLIAIVVSIITLCLFWFRIEPFEMDLFGILASILSVLVTVLIGWNVFSVININSLEKRVDKKIEKKIKAKTKKEIEKSQSEVKTQIKDISDEIEKMNTETLNTYISLSFLYSKGFSLYNNQEYSNSLYNLIQLIEISLKSIKKKKIDTDYEYKIFFIEEAISVIEKMCNEEKCTEFIFENEEEYNKTYKALSEIKIIVGKYNDINEIISYINTHKNIKSNKNK